MQINRTYNGCRTAYLVSYRLMNMKNISHRSFCSCVFHFQFDHQFNKGGLVIMLISNQLISCQIKHKCFIYNSLSNILYSSAYVFAFAILLVSICNKMSRGTNSTRHSFPPLVKCSVPM